jgi:pilus assembly protein CpaE
VTPKVIVNKYRRNLLGSSISMHEVKEILRGSFAGTVGAEERLIREAIDRGIPTTAIKPRNAVMTDLAKILEA